MKLISLCSLVVGTSAFAPARTLPLTNSAINVNQNVKYFSANAKTLNAVTSPPPVSKPPVPENQKVPELMGEDIYNFNKFIIDTVYDIICFFYPVKGTKRDFARFYVLETVARVPYFGR